MLFSGRPSPRGFHVLPPSWLRLRWCSDPRPPAQTMSGFFGSTANAYASWPGTRKLCQVLPPSALR